MILVRNGTDETQHWVLDVFRLFDAAINHNTGPGALDLYYANLVDPRQITVTGLFECEVLVGDFILIYRLYHVYRPMWWVCVVPIGCWVMLASKLNLSFKVD